MALYFNENEHAAVSVTERVCSAVSLAGSGIVVATFIGSTSFRKPVNRLVFYASFGNIMANVGTMISESGVHRGQHSSLCQFQAFTIQWFLPADSLWALAMACNVYLALFHNYTLVLAFINTKSNGKAYGLAIQWCWISLSYDYLQIAVFYAPVWFIILFTFVIYARIGLYIFQQRRRLNKYTVSDSTLEIQPYRPRGAYTNVTEQPECTTRDEQTGERACESSHGLWNNGNAQLDMSAATPEVVVAWAYSKYAMLFFTALLITWVPSSVNRLYALSRHNHHIFGLTYASSFVLPLQGFWNAVIYITVSWQSFKMLPFPDDWEEYFEFTRFEETVGFGAEVI
ncbi:hypothetical protein N7497_000905 [Penicillium chrysogenum]|nr:hypothetical protein N7497_000905 [Penicillium chrysogenum]